MVTKLGGAEDRWWHHSLGKNWGSDHAFHAMAPALLYQPQSKPSLLELFPPMPPSSLQLVETLSSLVPGEVSATGHFVSPVPQRGTA